MASWGRCSVWYQGCGSSSSSLLALAFCAFVSNVLNSGQVMSVKHCSALPNAAVAVSRSFNDVSVWRWNFARACHEAKIDRSSTTEVLCGSGSKPSMHGTIHWHITITRHHVNFNTVKWGNAPEVHAQDCDQQGFSFQKHSPQNDVHCH